MAYENIIFEIEGDVAVIKFNRPKALNAVNIDVVKDIQKALDEVESSRSVRVLILTGEGDKAFVAGADIRTDIARHTVQAVYASARVNMEAQVCGHDMGRGAERRHKWRKPDGLWRQAQEEMHHSCVAGNRNLIDMLQRDADTPGSAIQQAIELLEHQLLQLG